MIKKFVQTTYIQYTFTLHVYIFYIIEQDIRIDIYVAHSRPNGWTDLAEIFVDTHEWPGV